MKLLSCLSPKVIYNTSLKRKVVVRCGKCEACVNARSANWVQRLDQEIYYSAFTFFVTFQYDELHVNQLIRLRDEDNPSNLPSYIDSDTGLIVSLEDCHDIKEKDIIYCNETKILLIPSVRDFQLFLKSLRKHIFKHYGQEKIRYYCAFEVGPTTYRPHAHCLFFFNSSLLAQDFGMLCNKYWKYGSVYDPHIVVGSASQYVASYVNCLTHLPAIYLHKEIRPRSVFSKRPPIGYCAFKNESRKELFFKQEDEFTIFKQISSKFCNVPLWRSFRNSIYCFIVKFGSLSYLDRIALYRVGKYYDNPFFEKIAILTCLDCGYYINFYTQIKGTKYYRYNEDSFKRFLRIVSRAYQFACDCGISVEYYVFLLSEYYEKKQFLDLKAYFVAQNEYFKEHDVCDFLSFDPDFASRVNGKMFYELDPWLQHYVKLYIRFDYAKPIQLNLHNTFAFRELYKLHRKISFDNSKTKEATDYLMSHADKFHNIINYKNS